MSVRVLIVEDEAVLAETAKSMLTSCGYEVVGITNNKQQALQIINSIHFDIAFLDINLGDRFAGIEIGEILDGREIPFIYLTSYADKTTIDRAKKTRPCAYLLKPFEKDDLYSAVEIAIAGKEREQPHVFIKEGHLMKKLYISDILWLKTENIYLEIHTTKGRHLLRKSLDQMMELLPADRFVRTHRSYAVSISKVDTVHSQFLQVGEDQIPVSRSLKEQVDRAMSAD